MIIGNKIHIGSRRKVHNGSKLNYTSAEVDTYMEGLTTPLSSGQEEKLRTFVVDLKRGLRIKNLADAFDVMYILGGETAESSLRNLVKNAHHATAVNSPAFTALEGFEGNGTSSYLKTNYTASIDAIRYTLNSASFGVYSRSDLPSTGSQVEFGARNTGNTNQGWLQIYASSSFCPYGGINSNAVNSRSLKQNSLGFCAYNRYGSSNVRLIRDKIKYTGSTQSSSLPENEFVIDALNQSGSILAYSNKQISFVFVAKSFADDEMDILVDAIEAYMDSNGKGVIS